MESKNSSVGCVWARVSAGNQLQDHCHCVGLEKSWKMMYHTWGPKIRPSGAWERVRARESAGNQLQDHRHCVGLEKSWKMMYHTWGQKIIPLGACKCVKACESAWNQLQDHHHCDGHTQKPLSRHFGHLNSSTGSKVIENNVKSAWKSVKVREISCGNIAIATGSKNRGKWCTICWGKLKKFFHQNSRLEVISSVLQPETLLLPSSWALSSALSSFWINIFLFTLLYLGNKGSYQKTVKSGPPLIFRARRNGDGPAADFCQTKPNLAKFHHRIGSQAP